nr:MULTISPECIES: hypothetical protein [Bradyrhizobium]
MDRVVSGRAEAPRHRSLARKFGSSDEEEKCLGQQLGLRSQEKAYFAKDGVSPFVLTTQVLEHNDWTPSIVAARQKQLCDKLEDPPELNRRRVDVDPTSLTPTLRREGKAFPCGFAVKG